MIMTIPTAEEAMNKRREADLYNALFEYLKGVFEVAIKNGGFYCFDIPGRRYFNLFYVDKNSKLQHLEPPMNPLHIQIEDDTKLDDEDEKCRVTSLMIADRHYIAGLMGFNFDAGGFPDKDTSPTGKGLDVIKHLASLIHDGSESDDKFFGLGITSFRDH